MEPRYVDLSLTAQTAYAQLFDAVQARSIAQAIAELNGSFARKNVRNSTYWYFQYRDIDGRVKQIYVGPDSQRIQSLITAKSVPPPTRIGEFSIAAAALGCSTILPKHFRIIRRLGEYGFFRAGGVLIGTHAYLAMGNLLGVKWTDGERTQDVDFARFGRNISIALPWNVKIDIHSAVESLEMGFLPIQSFDGCAGATYLNPDEPDLRIDFLTPATSTSSAPFAFDQLNVSLQPLKFMEYPLESTTRATLLSRGDALLVNIPSPIRYGLHKLIVHGERTEAYRTKSAKDLVQSAAIIAYYAQRERASLDQAMRDLVDRGRGWRSRAKKGAMALVDVHPDFAGPLSGVLGRPSPAVRGKANKGGRK